MVQFSQDAYLDSLARKFYNQGAGAATNAAPASSAFQGLLGDGSEDAGNNRPAPSKGESRRPTNPVGWVIDVLSRPGYAVGQTIRETKNRAEDGFDLGDAAATFNPLNLLQNVAVNDRELPHEPLLENWKPETNDGRIAKAVAGFGIDVATDPLMYVPGSAFVKAGRGITRGAGSVAGLTKRRGPKQLGDEIVESVPAANAAAATPETAAVTPEALEIGGRIPESRQITAGPRALEATPSPNSAPRNFEMGNERTPAPAPAPDAPPRTFAMGLAESSANKITDGTFVAPRTPEIAQELNLARAEEGIEQPKRQLKHVKTGEVIPFSQRLVNLSTQRKAYPDLAVTAPFKTVDEAPVQAPEVVPEVTSPQPSAVPDKPLPIMEWVKAFGDTEIPVGPGLTNSLKGLVENSKSPDKIRAQRANARIREAYAEYVRAPRAIPRTPTASEAKAARKAATEAARARSEAVTPKVARLTGDEYEAFKQDLRTKVSAEDYTRLLRQKTPESFDKVVQELKTKKIRTPIYEEVLEITPAKIAEDVAQSVPESLPPGVVRSKRTEPKRKPQAIQDQAAINEAKMGVTTVDEQMAAIEPPTIAIAKGEHLSPEALNALGRAIDEQQWAGVKDDFKFRSPIQQALKDKAQVGQGNAIHQNAANQHFQGNLFRGLIAQYSAKVPPELSGLDRGDWLYKNMMPALRQSEQFLRANGIMPIGSVSKEGYPIALSEVIDGLMTFTPGKDFVKGRIFTTTGMTRGMKGSPGTVDPTSLLAAAHLISEQLGKTVTIADSAELRAALEKIIKPGEFRNNVEEAITGRGITSRGKPVSPEASAKVVGQAADLFMNPTFMGHVFDAVMTNTAYFGAKFNAEVKELSNSSMQNVVEILRNPLASPAAKIEAIANPDDIVEIVAKTEVPVDLKGSVDGAKEAVREQMTDVVHIDDVTSATNRVRMSEKVATGTREEVKEAAQKTYQDDVASAFSAAPPTLLLNISDATDLAMQSGILKKLAPLMTAINPAWGNATLHSAITTGGSVAKLLQKQWRHEIAQVDRQFTKTEFADAIKWLQGMERADDLMKAEGRTLAAALKLKPIFNMMFEVDQKTGTHGVLSAFGREGFDIKHINEKLKYVYRDTDGKFPQFTPKTRTKKQWVQRPDGVRYQKNVTEEYYDADTFQQWREWDIGKDPLDFMARMETAFAGLATDMAIAQEGFRIASSLGYASKTRRAGMVQVGDQEVSTIGRYMPKGAWFDPDILTEIKRMDEILAESATLNSGLGQFINRNLDPILNMWKSGMTVWRPGHHVRNFVGDSMLSYYAHGVTNPEYYRKAMQMQTLRGEYDGWSALQALQGTNRTPVGNAVKANNIKVRVGRKGLTVSDRDIHQGLMARGVLPDFRVQEDLIESGNNPRIQRLQAAMAVTGGRAKEVVGRVSEARDDTVRIAHALHLLENGITANPRMSKGGPAFANLEDALDQVAAAVRRYHPDGADLTGFERKYMRRLMPFYSWSRKAFPLIAEAMLTQPGRVMMFPKATYAYAEAQGIDPESISNPFPDDQLFPSFIEDRSTGPVYKNSDGAYFGVAPGAPAMDILDDFVGNPKGGIVGMLNPFLKAPAELATGHSASTGAEIHDVGEYVDSQIPGVSTFSSMSGYSTTGTPWSILSGNGLDEQRAVTQGNKGHFDKESIINYLLGVGAQNFSKQSYINSAELEDRDEKARLLEKLRGQ